MVIQGDLTLMSPAALLQSLCQERRSVRLRGWRGLAEAEIGIVEGMVVTARCGDLRGPEAVYQFAAWDSGRFEVEAAEPPEEVEMAAEWEELLLEGARRRDELENGLPPLPPYPPREVLDHLQQACPALGGFALLGVDGRLLGALGLDSRLLQQVDRLGLNLSALGRTLGQRHGVALYAGGGRKLLVTDYSDDMLVIGVPAPGATVGEATSQLAALAVERTGA